MDPYGWGWGWAPPTYLAFGALTPREQWLAWLRRHRRPHEVVKPVRIIIPSRLAGPGYVSPFREHGDPLAYHSAADVLRHPAWGPMGPVVGALTARQRYLQRLRARRHGISASPQVWYKPQARQVPAPWYRSWYPGHREHQHGGAAAARAVFSGVGARGPMGRRTSPTPHGPRSSAELFNMAWHAANRPGTPRAVVSSLYNQYVTRLRIESPGAFPQPLPILSVLKPGPGSTAYRTIVTTSPFPSAATRPPLNAPTPKAIANWGCYLWPPGLNAAITHEGYFLSSDVLIPAGTTLDILDTGTIRYNGHAFPALLVRYIPSIGEPVIVGWVEENNIPEPDRGGARRL